MQIGFIGLGRMGKAMVEHLLESGIDVVVYNRTNEKVDMLKSEYQNSKSKTNSKLKTQKLGNLIPTYTVEDLIKSLESPRIIWLMVPHGPPVDEMIDALLQAGVTKDDIVIDGGNSFYKDSIRRNTFLKTKGIHFLDIGTSGGLEGARQGACLMVGGDRTIYHRVRPLLVAIAGTKGGYTYFGQSGSGHFVKMVHNGVEYGMLQSIGEGFEMLAKGPYKLNLHAVAYNWTKGSVVRGWLMELLETALKKDPDLQSINGIIGGGETGGWTVEVAKEEGVETPAIESSLQARKKSLDKPTFSGKVIAALRREFGGHAIQKTDNSKQLTADTK